MGESSRTLVFIPTYKEAENVGRLAAGILSLELDADILFIDDNSPDGTGALLEQLATDSPRIHVVHRSGKLGIGSAHQDGIRWAYDHDYSLLVTMDCDFTHSPVLIPEFLAEASQYDVVIGSRYLKKDSLRDWNFTRRLLTRTGHFLTTRLLRLPHDATGAFRVYRLDRIPSGLFSLVQSIGYSFFFESLYVLTLNRFKIKEVAIDLPSRTYGHSKMRMGDALNSLMLLAYLWLRRVFDSQSLVYAEPFEAEADLSPTSMQRNWDEYWGKKNDASKLLYDLIAAIYRKAIIKPSLTRFISRHFPPHSRLLHAGCGSGQVDIDIADRIQISALDISALALRIYRKSNPKAEQLIHGSIFNIPAPDESFDGVYSLGVMEHFTEPEILQILREFHRVVRAGGKIVLFWPPSFGLTVRVLAGVHWFANKVLSKPLKLHPDEITHVRSKRQVRAYLKDSGFMMVDFYFGVRDVFTQAVVVGYKPTRVDAIGARDTPELARANRH
jgi:dolichol-phosphate mannosyltransferase